MTSDTSSAGNTASVPNDTKVTRIPGVKLDIPPGKEVILRIPGYEHSYRGTIIGLDPYDYIIAKVRLPSSLRKELKFGGEVVIKYVNQGTIYGFKAHVHNAISKPAPLIFFDYPDIIEKLPLRRTPRSQCSIDGTIHTTEEEIECMVVNVSETGCRVSARVDTRGVLRNTKVDDALIATMNLGSLGELKVAVAVKNIQQEKGIISLGCMFLDITDKETNAIQKYLDKLSRHTN
ncbi:conserved protein of unknown function [Pseudodesulfovibrio profundus]|uniref:Type IV pilus assembly PilZ n=1 Tax=Pseudodesulfovibrio profundus TaxID=57320 RepID=A0A2C8F9D4_9BACT|nr:flagellar brake protein [Pseudodesulfovibrio profundus]MBC15989.1 pilus assembly protein PilZ [Desulfovibrio sp.]SOB59386.1 conserved protein of unknown function [Pseudodesulfovibrio profundus]|tara:strand:- start:14396 stop:15094 length:699 start_codon:yes stop_codon:yes gene_type:complete